MPVVIVVAIIAIIMIKKSKCFKIIFFFHYLRLKEYVKINSRSFLGYFWEMLSFIFAVAYFWRLPVISPKFLV